MTAAWHLVGGQHVQRNAGGARKPPPPPPPSPPPPPPPPLNFPPFSLPDPNNSNQGSYLSRAFNSNVMVVLAVVLFALVVVAVLNTLARCRIMRRLRMQQQLGPLDSQQQRQQQQQQQQQRQHKGLEKAEIEALPVITYGVGKLDVQDVGSHDCVVCLSEYQKGEKLRLLPLCSHGFHVDCIDTWLFTHTSCPVCRHSVLQSSSSTENHQTTNPPPPPPEEQGEEEEEEHHQQQQQAVAASSQEEGDGASASVAAGGDDNVQGTTTTRRSSSNGTTTTTTGRARFGSALFGSARSGSTSARASASSQQHTEIEVGDVAAAAGGASASGNRWSSFSAILWPAGLARLSSGAAAWYARRQGLLLWNQAAA